MKNSSVILVALLLGLALGTSAAATLQVEKPSKTQEVTAKVVSADAKLKKLTYEVEKGKPVTLPVDELAAPALATLQKGQDVVLTVRSNDKGEPEMITAIKIKSTT